MGDGGMVTVPVKSAAKSKINFGAVALLILGLLQMAGVHIDDTVKQNFGDAVGMIAQVFQSVILPVLIIIWRTWFNNTVTPAAGGGA